MPSTCDVESAAELERGYSTLGLHMLGKQSLGKPYLEVISRIQLPKQ